MTTVASLMSYGRPFGTEKEQNYGYSKTRHSYTCMGPVMELAIYLELSTFSVIQLLSTWSAMQNHFNTMAS